MYTLEMMNITPNVHMIIDGYELYESDGVSYWLEAESSRAEIVSADVISGETLTLKTGSLTGESVITLTTHTLPTGRTMTQTFTVYVVNTSSDYDTGGGVRGTSHGGGGCNSGFLLLAGVLISLAAMKKGE